MWAKAKLIIAGALTLVFLPIAANSVQADQFVLNGSAAYFNLTREYYVGGLYLPTQNDDPDYIRSASTAKRMQLVIRLPSWSPRSWAQFWQNNIAINNDNLSPTPQMQQTLMEFTSFPRQDLKAGDELIIDYQPNGNSRVLLNGDLVLEAPGTDFFNYMVNTWIGKLPPTREFRQQILGQEAPNQTQQQLLLGHQAARLGLFAGWVAAEQAAVRAQKAANEAEQRRLAQSARDERQKAEELAKAADTARQQQTLVVQRSQLEAEEKERAERARQQQLKQEQSIKAQADRLNRSNQSSSAQVLAQEQRYYLNLLQWQLQRQVEASVTYPAWAKQFNQEGFAIIDLRLNRKQEISEVQARDENISALLNNELQRAAAVAAEKITIPKELAGDSWPLTVRYQFSLQNKVQPELAMPQAPASLQKTVSATDSKQLEQNYRQQQITRIQEAVVYPPGARILKKQDKVSIEVDLDEAGRVVAVRELHSSRHRELNQAMHDAVKKSEPYPPLPLELKLKKISFTVNYEFKL